MSIRIGILGYGNLAKGVESAIMQNDDLELAAVFTRRDPASVSIRTAGVPVLSQDAAADMKDSIDVLVICGGSATDLPVQTPKYAEMFNVVDSFDTHANIPVHFANVDAAAKKGGKIGLISCGWDPGMFSLNRLYMNCILPEGRDYTFWGKGVSQGHSDAVRRIEGVIDARQYTIPVDAAVESVRKGENPELTADEMKKDHSGLPHGGSVIRSGVTGIDKEHTHVIEYSLKLDSNPEFTGSVLAAYARAVARMSKEGRTGAVTVFDVAARARSPSLTWLPSTFLLLLRRRSARTFCKRTGYDQPAQPVPAVRLIQI